MLALLALLAIAHAGPSADRLVEKAGKALEKGREDRARALLEEAVALDPHHRDAALRLGALLADAGEWDAARTHLCAEHASGAEAAAIRDRHPELVCPLGAYAGVLGAVQDPSEHGGIFGAMSPTDPPLVATEGGLGARTPRSTGPTVLGAIDEAEVRAVLAAASEAFHACQAEAPVTVRFVVQADGAVLEAEVRKGGGDAAVEACLLERVRGLVFPPVDGGGVAIVIHAIEAPR